MKIYSMNAEDNQIKLGTLDESCAILQIYLAESSNNLFLELFSSNTGKSISKKIYLDTELNRLDVEIKRNEVELKYKDKRLKNYYSVEFIELDEFKDIVGNAKESSNLVLSDSSLDSRIDEFDYEEPKELAKSLEIAISSGQLEQSASYAKKLAQIKADIQINLKKNLPKHNDDTGVILDEDINELTSKLIIQLPVKDHTIKLDIHISTAKTIYQLKTEVYFGIIHVFISAKFKS